MTDPFRDGFQAALARAENLEDENVHLREEIERLRQSSMALRDHTDALPESSAPETRELASKALDVLEKLEAVSQRGAQLRVSLGDRTFTGTERPLSAVTPTSSPVAAPSELAPLLNDPWTEPLQNTRKDSPFATARWMVATAVLSFVAGFVARGC